MHRHQSWKVLCPQPPPLNLVLSQGRHLKLAVAERLHKQATIRALGPYIPLALWEIEVDFFRSLGQSGKIYSEMQVDARRCTGSFIFRVTLCISTSNSISLHHSLEDS